MAARWKANTRALTKHGYVKPPERQKSAASQTSDSMM